MRLRECTQHRELRSPRNVHGETLTMRELDVGLVHDHDDTLGERICNLQDRRLAQQIAGWIVRGAEEHELHLRRRALQDCSSIEREALPCGERYAHHVRALDACGQRIEAVSRWADHDGVLTGATKGSH